MSISNELTGDIIAALLNTENKSRRDLTELKEVLCTVHSTLQEMTKDQRSEGLKASPKDVEKGVSTNG